MSFELAERQVQDKTLIVPQLNPSRIPPVIALSPFAPSQASTVPGKRTRGNTTTGSGPTGGVRLLDGHRAGDGDGELHAGSGTGTGLDWQSPGGKKVIVACRGRSGKGGLIYGLEKGEAKSKQCYNSLNTHDQNSDSHK
jgi:hypothetical protein